MANSFCTNCGASLNPGSKFCGKCGSKIADQAVTPQAPAAATQAAPPRTAAPAPNPTAQSAPVSADVSYKYIIPAQYKKGLVSVKACTIIFTDAEVLVALVDNKIMQQHMQQVREDVKGEKFLKRAGAVMKAGYTFADRYWNMTRNQIMGESTGNFIIANNTVQQVKFSKGTTNHYTDETASTTPPSLVFKTIGGKFTFTFNFSVDTRTFLPMLQTVFFGRYKGPKH